MTAARADEGAAPIYELRRYRDADALADAAAARIAELLGAALRERGRAVAALSGGSTPQRAYAKLSRADIDWPRVSVTLVDDRWAPPSDPRSNQNLLDMTLFYDGGAKGARFAPLWTGDDSPETGVAAAEARLRGLARPFDVVVLGMGQDGHTASLFPGGDRLHVALDPDGEALLTPMRAPGAPEPRITLTLSALLQARRILLVFSGERKQRVFRQALGAGAVEEMPIRAILRQRRVPVEVLCTEVDAELPADPLAGVWHDVEAARDRLAGRRIADLFDEDATRFETLSARLDDLLLDYSKTGLDAGARDALVRLAEAAEVPARRDALFAGRPVNATEGRAALHPALRADPGDRFEVEGEDVMPAVLESRERCLAFAEAVRSGEVAGPDGPFADVVNIGIGGSDLGPVMAAQALSPDLDGPRLHFVSNVDGAHVTDVLRGLDPRRTLVLVASKTFTTIETMTNAATARDWIAAAVGPDAAGAHFAAISTAAEEVAAFGIAPERMFGFWDWVGGRYSVWSAIGLSLMIGLGRADWLAFLSGARAMDRHFREAPADRNLPILMGLIGVWHRNALGHASRAVLPYDQRLARLPAYLQQLDMESNGKTARLGPGLAGDTGPVVWGEPGTNGQHAFFQLLHQGATTIPCEFIAAAEGREPGLAHHHRLLLANCLAQSEALMRGRGREAAEALLLAEGVSPSEAAELAPHRAFPGSRPSVTLIHRRLDPYSLGRLVALYEHRVFVEASIWGINPFDQWGVELGKTLARGMAPLLEGGSTDGASGSTLGLAAWIRDRAGEDGAS